MSVRIYLCFVDRRKNRTHFFATRLEHSRYVAVTIVDDRRVDTLVRCLGRDFVA